MQPKMVQCVCLRMLSSDLCGENSFWDFEKLSDHPDHCRKVLIIPEGISSQNVPNGPSLKAPSCSQYYAICIHPKNENVCRFCFSVQKNLRNKCVNSHNKILRQKCINHRNSIFLDALASLAFKLSLSK